MNKSILKPECVFEQFARINEIPRPSKREEKMIAYLMEWGREHGLETKCDKTGNVIICKPATAGMENRKTIILQSHMDMVCDKLVDVDFDFDAVRTEIRNKNKTGTPEQKKAVKTLLNSTGKKLDELEDVEILTKMLEVFE